MCDYSDVIASQNFKCFSADSTKDFYNSYSSRMLCILAMDPTYYGNYIIFPNSMAKDSYYKKYKSYLFTYNISNASIHMTTSYTASIFFLEYSARS